VRSALRFLPVRKRVLMADARQERREALFSKALQRAQVEFVRAVSNCEAGRCAVARRSRLPSSMAVDATALKLSLFIDSLGR
jgi:hypothetical protein